MKEFNELKEKGKKQRLNKVYSILDCETSDCIYDLYNDLDDNGYSEEIVQKLRTKILNDNNQARHYNSRNYNYSIYDLLK